MAVLAKIAKVKPPSTAIMLPPNNQWTNRFKIVGESGRFYIIAQNKKRGHWGCSCPGYLRHRKCKHLTALGLPWYEEPYFPKRIEAM